MVASSLKNLWSLYPTVKTETLHKIWLWKRDIPNIKGLWLVVSHKKNFKVFPRMSLYKTSDPWGGAEKSVQISHCKQAISVHWGYTVYWYQTKLVLCKL